MQEMERLVDNNPNLSWDGWDVIHKQKDDYAEFSNNGVFDNLTMQWYRKTVFTCTEEGWEIPESVM